MNLQNLQFQEKKRSMNMLIWIKKIYLILPNTMKFHNCHHIARYVSLLLKRLQNKEMSNFRGRKIASYIARPNFGLSNLTSRGLLPLRQKNVYTANVKL